MAGKTVMAFGAFDGIHRGHLYYLSEAKKLGKLIVSVAPDRFFGLDMMYRMTEDERSDLVRALRIVDKVVLGKEMNALARVEEMRPDMVVITPYHWVDEAALQQDLKKKGLKTKVVVLKPYKPESYGQIYDFAYVSLKEKRLSGLPIRKKK